ncbi:nicotinate-nucleotide diphosphorylase [Blumeria hordei DH14]|uniref:Nicotinate-nucleotide diphosphorylase n=1 Tax=Blumeria graminis f. sp. hordei (strain DH14) TaxID=546991 RepID=N1JJ55_BLUG1|nr:nicotinate-nucleotide diphosphorylase [Blumeria hordei DH14]
MTTESKRKHSTDSEYSGDSADSDDAAESSDSDSKPPQKIPKYNKYGKPKYFLASNFRNILPLNWKSQIAAWCTEDLPPFDYAEHVVGHEVKTATLYGKSEGYLAGVPFFEEVFHYLGCEVKWHVNEGVLLEDKADEKTAIATVTGPVNKILYGETTAIDLLSRCSAIATQTSTLNTSLESINHSSLTVAANTHSMTPGFRLVEEYGLSVGGVHCKQFDPSSTILLDQNHIKACKSVNNMIEVAKAACGLTCKIVLTVDNERDAISACRVCVDTIKLENLQAQEIKSIINKSRGMNSPSLFAIQHEVTRYWHYETSSSGKTEYYLLESFS